MIYIEPFVCNDVRHSRSLTTGSISWYINISGRDDCIKQYGVGEGTIDQYVKMSDCISLSVELLRCERSRLYIPLPKQQPKQHNTQ